MQEIQWLSDRVAALLRRYAALRAENRGLKETIGRQSEEIARLEEQLRGSEDRLLAAEVAGLVPEGKEREKVRHRLDAVISEIDKILTNLND